MRLESCTANTAPGLYLPAGILLTLKPHRQMRGAAMSLPAAASGLVVLLLTVPGTVCLHLCCRVALQVFTVRATQGEEDLIDLIILR